MLPLLHRWQTSPVCCHELLQAVRSPYRFLPSAEASAPAALAPPCSKAQEFAPTPRDAKPSRATPGLRLAVLTASELSVCNNQHQTISLPVPRGLVSLPA